MRLLIASCALACLYLLSTSAFAESHAIRVSMMRDRVLWLEFAQPMQTWSNENDAIRARVLPDNTAECSWGSDRRLVCELSRRLAPATAFQLEVAEGLKSVKGDAIPAQLLDFESERPRLGVSTAQWVEGQGSIVLQSNLPLDAESLRTSLAFELDGQPMNPAPPLIAINPSDPRSFRIDLSSVDGHDRLLRISVLPGLRSLAGPLPGKLNLELLRAELRTSFRVRELLCTHARLNRAFPAEAGVAEATCSPDSPVSLVFTREPDAPAKARIEAAIAEATRRQSARRLPTSQLHWRSDWSYGHDVHRPRGSRLELPPLKPGSTIKLALGDSTLTADAASLAPVSIHLRMADSAPQLRADHMRTLLRGVDLGDAGIEAVNTGRIEVGIHAIGSELQQETQLIRASSEGSRPTLARSRVARHTLAEGGWVGWSPGSSKDIDSAHVQFAAPAFDLAAWAGQREVLAWANAWEGDGPVAGAEVELLLQDTDGAALRAVAVGQTGADGSALLRLPSDVRVATPDSMLERYNWTGPLWVLRARRPGNAEPRLAVLPLGRSSAWFSLGTQVQPRSWGFSDRPFYRAGDTVRYRLFQREQRGADWGPSSHTGESTIILAAADSGQPLQQWTAQFDASGSLHGELVLPRHLTDDTYCIGIRGDYETEGSCFYVGNYRAQDLWVELSTPGGVVHEGERLQVNLGAGYFSGGPAAGLDVVGLSVTLWPVSPGVVYSDYADFAFLDADAEDELEYPDLDLLDDAATLDAKGKRIASPEIRFVRDQNTSATLPAFGYLVIDAELSPEGRDPTIASDESTLYARFGRYVGLRTVPAWFGAHEPVMLEAVVLEAGGKPVAAEVEVEVEFVPSMGDDTAKDAAKPQRLVTCRLLSSTPTRCDFPRTHSGRYRFRASSADAAPAVLTRYVWTGDVAVDRGDSVEAELHLEYASPQRDRPLRLRLEQPYADAQAMLIVSWGRQLLAHQSLQLTQPSQIIEVPVQPEWTGALTIRALVRAEGEGHASGPLRSRARTQEVDLEVPPADTSAASPPIAIEFTASAAKLGSRAVLNLRNTSERPQDVSIAVMDDALRTLAQTWLPYADPYGPVWLEGPLNRPSGGLALFDFSEWNDSPWRWLLPQAEAQAPQPTPTTALEHAGIPVSGSGIGVYGVDSEIGGVVYGGGSELDRIDVTGSRINRSDVVEASTLQRPDAALRTNSRPSPGHTPLDSQASWLRSNFADTALWLPQLRLAPGESRAIELTLPDNLTRWRAVVWSSGGGRDFAMSETTLDVGLPLEVRVQAPSRIYPGDTAWVGTHARSSGELIGAVGIRLQGEDGGAQVDASRTVQMDGPGQAAMSTRVQASTAGPLQLIATASSTDARDALAARVDVASALINARRVQAGWLGADTLRLVLPTLPAGARNPQLTVSLHRGGEALLNTWTADMQHYPHRCWEQILSRAVAAALAIQRGDQQWPDAQAAIDEALQNAAVFQSYSGTFNFFADQNDYSPGSYSAVPLTAYSVRALETLKSLGATVPERPLLRARAYLEALPTQSSASGDRGPSLDMLALAAWSGATDASTLDRLADNRHTLSAEARIATAAALLQAQHPRASEALLTALELAPETSGERRLTHDSVVGNSMASRLQLQCALIDLVRNHSEHAPADAVQGLLAGIIDLYAGGASAVDTYTGAACLQAVQPREAEVESARVQIEFGRQSAALTLASSDKRAEWGSAVAGESALTLRRDAASNLPLSFVAAIDLEEDMREARASALGFSVTRQYAVLTPQGWADVQTHTPTEGDWIRVTLRILTSAERNFVALSDAAPGGLVPTDLALSAVASHRLRSLDTVGSPHFSTRRLDPRTPRFYAERLPAGEHVVHYFARATHPGDYLAAPATLELMYGHTSHARTAATRLRIHSPRGGKDR